jgi:hypothetical protein
VAWFLDWARTTTKRLVEMINSEKQRRMASASGAGSSKDPSFVTERTVTLADAAVLQSDGVTLEIGKEPLSEILPADCFQAFIEGILENPQVRDTLCMSVFLGYSSILLSRMPEGAC